MSSDESMHSLDQQIVEELARHPQIRLGILFGSAARQRKRPESDLDLAVAARCPLDVPEKIPLIEALSQMVSRPIDLVDLQSVGGLLLKEIVTTGKAVYCTDKALHAELIKKMLFNEADFMPYRDRINAQRRRAWIGA